MNKNEIKNILLIFLLSFFYYKQKTEVDYYLGEFLEKMINIKKLLNNVLNIFKKNKIIENKNDDDIIIVDLDIPKTTKKSIHFLWKYLIILSILIVTKFKKLLLNKKNNNNDGEKMNNNNDGEEMNNNNDGEEMNINSDKEINTNGCEEINNNKEKHDNQEKDNGKEEIHNNEEKHDN